MLKNFNTDLIQENDSLLLAVSGGIDSMVMLYNLIELKKTMNIEIAVAHFDHQKRSDSSLDYKLIKKTCDELSLNCYLEKLNLEEITDNFHDFSRKKRYDFFKKVAKDIGANKIVLAHNSNDLAETILMRLTRGTSFEGYRGILETANYKGTTIIRPLLHVSKNEIMTYQKLNSTPYNEDSSNNEDDYTRNRYRHHVLPLLELENPKYLGKFHQFSEYLSKAYKLIDNLATSYIKSSVSVEENHYTLNVYEFLELEEIIQIDVIKKLINLQTKNQVELNFQNIKDILKLFSNKKPHLEFELINNLFIHKSYNTVYISNNKLEFDDYQYEIKDLTKINLDNGDLIIVTKNPNKYYDNMFKLCYNNLDFVTPITVRNRRNGDKIKTESGTKKLKDIFINKKIPLNKRNKLPVFLNKDNKIIWVPGIYKSKSNGNKYIYLIYQEG